MDNKKKGPAKQTPPDAEVLKAVRELPQTTKSRFRLLLEPKTIEEALTRCFYAVGSERGTDIVIDECDKRALAHIAETLTNPESLIGFVFSGSYDSGKTTFMLVFQKFLSLLKNHPKAWEYQEINSLDCKFIRAEEFRYPLASYETFEEAAKAPVLFLDNLGYEEECANERLAKTLVKTLIRFRSDNRLLTLIATPFDPQTIRETYGIEVAHRLFADYFWCDCFRVESSDTKHP